MDVTDDEKNEYLAKYLAAVNDPRLAPQINRISQEAADERRRNAYVAQMADAASLMGATAHGKRPDVISFQKSLTDMSEANDKDAASQIKNINLQNQRQIDVNKYLSDRFEARNKQATDIAQQASEGEKKRTAALELENTRFQNERT